MRTEIEIRSKLQAGLAAAEVALNGRRPRATGSISTSRTRRAGGRVVGDRVPRAGSNRVPAERVGLKGPGEDS